MTTFALGTFPRAPRIIPVSFGSASSTYVEWTVPSFVTTIGTLVWGGAGGGSPNAWGYAQTRGGGGGYVNAIVNVTPGETLRVYVGGGGVRGPYNVNNPSGAGGGGWSGVFRSTTPLVIAGGGGGAASGGDTATRGGGRGGAGGGLTGESPPSVISGQAGKGGSQSAGGAGGSNTRGTAGTAGSSLTGGPAGNNNGSSGGLNGGGRGGTYGGAGGGGGYYGGGGGGSGNGGEDDDGGGGGGGGSSYLAASGVTLLENIQASEHQPAGTSSVHYVSGVGVGGLAGVNNTTGNGAAGRVVILF